MHAYSTWCVCVSVSVSAAILALQAMEGGLLATPTALELRQPEKYNSNFPEMIAFERYALKKNQKTNMHSHTGLLTLYPPALCIYEAQEVTMKGMY